MFDKRSIHIMIASDANYAEFVSVVIASLFDTNGNNFNQIHIHLFSNGIPESIIGRISLSIPKERGYLHTYDISGIKGELNIGEGDTMPISAYARLLLTKYIDKSISRILYVDCDVIFNGPINDLWEYEMGDNWIAGVLDAHMDSKPKINIGLPIDALYVNTGVLLIDLDKWRLNNIVGMFQNFINAYNGLVYHQDQGIINGVCNGHILILPPKYNAISYFYSHPYKLLEQKNHPFYSEAQIKDVFTDARMIHFTEGYLGRPWVKHCKHPLKNVFSRYHGMTDWADQPLRNDGRSLPLRISSLLFLHLPYNLYEKIMYILYRIK